jgi:hypothetical protein
MKTTPTMSCPSIYRSKRSNPLANLSFDTPALEAWFEARNLLDFDHLAHDILVYSEYKNEGFSRFQNFHSRKQHKRGPPPSVYQRRWDSNPASPVGLPVKDLYTCKIVYYENEWNLPTECVRHANMRAMNEKWNIVPDEHRWLFCLLALQADHERIFACLDREDREMLRAYWKEFDPKPLNKLRKSTVYRNIRAQDKEEDEAKAAKEKAILTAKKEGMKARELAAKEEVKKAIIRGESRKEYEKMGEKRRSSPNGKEKASEDTLFTITESEEEQQQATVSPFPK